MLKRRFSLFLTVILCFSVLAGCGTKTENNNKANEQIINLANDTVKNLKEKLKEPSTLHINSTVVSEVSGQSTVLGQSGDISSSNEEAFTYTVYIDYSAENSVGEITKAYFSASYFVSGDDVYTMDVPHEVSSIPQLSGTVYEISTSDLKSYSDTLK